MAITYNTTQEVPLYIYRATGGGVTFSANLTNTAVIDYFTDTAVVNDAIYFSKGTTYTYFSDITVNVGTAMAGTGITLVWEYYGSSDGSANAWVPFEKLQDDTVSFTVTGPNIVRFPIHISWCATTVNTVSSLWVRCRISALTTITEGGANQTTAPTVSNGRINIDGYTDLAPCTWTDVYNYMNTNYPYVGCVKVGSFFDFTRTIPRINSRLVSKNEVIELCCDRFGKGSVSQLGVYLDYLTNGEANPTDATRGLNGSTYIMNGLINTYPFEYTSNQLSYNTRFLNPTVYTADKVGSIGYPQLKGTFLDCELQMVPGVPLASCIVKNTRITMYTGFIATGFAGAANFVDNTLVAPYSTSRMFSLYQGSFTISGLTCIFNTTSGGSICGFNQTSNNGCVWNFLDPGEPFPGNADGGNLTVKKVTGTAGNIANVFTYDASADTYTSITSACSSATVGDVPVGGDEGDMIYFNHETSNSGSYHLKITSTLGTNDYVYKWEYYYNGAWREYTGGTWDCSYNFTTTGIMWRQRNFGALSLITINGVNSYWSRCTIVTKGTGTPMVDKIQRVSGIGTCDWILNVKYSMDLTLIDEQGNPIEGATLSLVDVYGTEQESATSDANGSIVSDAVFSLQYYFDPFDANRNTVTEVVEKDFNPYTVTISKSGYKTYKTIMTLNQKLTTTITLSKVKDLNFSKTVQRITQ